MSLPKPEITTHIAAGWNGIFSPLWTTLKRPHQRFRILETLCVCGFLVWIWSFVSVDVYTIRFLFRFLYLVLILSRCNISDPKYFSCDYLSAFIWTPYFLFSPDFHIDTAPVLLGEGSRLSCHPPLWVMIDFDACTPTKPENHFFGVNSMFQTYTVPLSLSTTSLSDRKSVV